MTDVINQLCFSNVTLTLPIHLSLLINLPLHQLYDTLAYIYPYAKPFSDNNPSLLLWHTNTIPKPRNISGIQFSHSFSSCIHACGETLSPCQGAWTSWKRTLMHEYILELVSFIYISLFCILFIIISNYNSLMPQHHVMGRV